MVQEIEENNGNRITPKGWAVGGAFIGAFAGYILPVSSFFPFETGIILIMVIIGSLLANEAEYQWIKIKSENGEFEAKLEDGSTPNSAERQEDTQEEDLSRSATREESHFDSLEERLANIEQSLQEMTEKPDNDRQNSSQESSTKIETGDSIKPNENIDSPTTDNVREDLGKEVQFGITQRIQTGYGELYITLTEDDNGELCEMFATIDQSGDLTHSFTEALANTISIALRKGVDPQAIVEELQGIRSPKVAWDRGAQVNSIPDAISIALRRYLKNEIDEEASNQSDLEINDTGLGLDDDLGERGSESNQATSHADGGLTDEISEPDDLECPECGLLTFVVDGYKTCEACGWSECESGLDNDSKE